MKATQTVCHFGCLGNLKWVFAIGNRDATCDNHQYLKKKHLEASCASWAKAAFSCAWTKDCPFWWGNTVATHYTQLVMWIDSGTRGGIMFRMALSENRASENLSNKSIFSHLKWPFGEFFRYAPSFLDKPKSLIHMINRYLFKSLFLMANPNIRSSWLYSYIIYIYTRYNVNCMENQLDLILGRYPTII